LVVPRDLGFQVGFPHRIGNQDMREDAGAARLHLLGERGDLARPDQIVVIHHRDAVVDQPGLEYAQPPDEQCQREHGGEREQKFGSQGEFHDRSISSRPWRWRARRSAVGSRQ